MTSYKKMNKAAKMHGYYGNNLRDFFLDLSRDNDVKPKFPHVKYVNQLIYDAKNDLIK